MDILLIEPPYRSLKGAGPDSGYNIGLPSLATFLREKDMEARVITCDLYEEAPDRVFALDYAKGQELYMETIDNDEHPVWKKIAADISSVDTSLIGIVFLTPMIHSVEKVIRIIKKTCPKIQILVGGHHPTFLPDEVMKNPDIDFIIRGEGEIPLYELIKALKTPHPDFKTVPSLTYRDQDKVIHNPMAPLIEDLDSLPYIERDLVINCDYNKHQGHYFNTARGCPYSCSFCADKRIWGGRIRRRSVRNAIDELLMLQKNYKIKMVDMTDGTFTYDRKYLIEFCKEFVKNKLTVPWRCTARYDNIDEEMLLYLKGANCQGLYFGLESGSEKILKAMNKKTNLDMILEKSEMVYRSGVESVAAILLGVPDEDSEDLESTIRIMKMIKVDLFDINNYVPLPGTSYYEKMTQEDRDKIEWKKTGYKSFSNCFSHNVSQAEFNHYLMQAYEIAKTTMDNFIAKNQQTA